MSNSAIKALTVELAQALDKASTSREIAQAIKKVADYGKPLVYNDKPLYGLGLVMLALSAVTVYVFGISYSDYPYGWMYLHDDVLTFLGVLVGLVGLVPIIFAFMRGNKLETLAAKAFYMDSLLDNGLSAKQAPEPTDIKMEFADFDRGNYSRAFRDYLQGRCERGAEAFDFDCFQYHYVNKHTTTYTTRDSKGNTRTKTRTTYYHYDRYGIIMNFGHTKDISISEDDKHLNLGESYSPASIIFNKKFTVKAKDKHEAAKFLVPAVVVAFEDFAQTFRDVGVEISSRGRLCLSFDNSDFLRGEQKYNFSQPKEYYAALLKQTELKRLDQALDFVQLLIKYSDSNF